MQDVEGGEKSSKQLKGRLKELLQASSGGRGTGSANGLPSRLSDGMVAGMSD